MSVLDKLKLGVKSVFCSSAAMGFPRVLRVAALTTLLLGEGFCSTEEMKEKVLVGGSCSFQQRLLFCFLSVPGGASGEELGKGCKLSCT